VTEEYADIPLTCCGECFWRHRRRLPHVETVPIWNAPMVEARNSNNELN